MASSKETNCVNEDCIPFTEIVSSTNRGSDSFEDEMDKGNGRTPRVWTSARRYTMWRGRSPTFWLIFTLILLLITFVLFVIFLALWIFQNQQLKDSPCLTMECMKTSTSILSSIDSTVSPCDDFYEYACNGWIREHQILPGENQLSVLRLVGKRTDYFMKDLLENHSYPNPSPGLIAAQTFYNSCMNEAAIQSHGFTPLYSALTKLFGGWLLLPEGSPGSRTDGGQFLTRDKFNLTAMYLGHLRIGSYTPVFKVSVGQNLRNSSEFLIELIQGHLSIQSDNYVNETNPTFEKVTSAYKRFLRNYPKLLGVPENKLGEMEKVYELEKRLAENMPDRNERDPEKYYLLTNLKNLTAICPIFDWKKLFNALYEPLNFTVTDNHPFALAEGDYFINRCKVYMEYLQTDDGIRTLHNLAVWQFVWHTKSMMPNEVDQLLNEFMEAETGLKVEPERWTKCEQETLNVFGFILSRFFWNEKFTEKSNEGATNMIKEIRQAFKENFATVEWMDEEDKVKAIEKVDAMGASVGYPKHRNITADELWFLDHLNPLNESTYFQNVLVASTTSNLGDLREIILQDENRWELQPFVVNAFYKETTNHIYFPAGILQPPVYDPSHPLSVNFGGIGMVVGHEITHAFDHQGAKRDAKGNLRQWWSNATRDAFIKKSQCMVEQYGNYSIFNTSLNGRMTLGENIADNGGMKAAYRAFKKLESKYSDGPKLPGVKFTPDQLFFISFAQMWCTKSLPRAQIATILYDAHTIDQYRVIGTLMNSEDFSKVFKCPLGSYMNPTNKCVVW